MKQMENKIINNKPSSLDYILAFMPVPVIGEIKALKVATHMAKQEVGNLYGDEIEILVRVIAARCAAYVSLAGIAGLIYTYYIYQQLIQ